MRIKNTWRKNRDCYIQQSENLVQVINTIQNIISLENPLIYIFLWKTTHKKMSERSSFFIKSVEGIRSVAPMEIMGKAPRKMIVREEIST